MHDQVEALREAASGRRCSTRRWSYDEAAAVEARLSTGDLDLLYVAPERLLTPRCLDCSGATNRAVRDRRGALRLAMGPRLPPRIYRTLGDLERFPDVPRIALTATADELTRRRSSTGWALTSAPSFVASFDRPNIRYEIVDKQNAAQLEAFIAGATPATPASSTACRAPRSRTPPPR